MSSLVRYSFVAVALAVWCLVGLSVEVSAGARTARSDVELVVTVAATGLAGQVQGVADREEQLRVIGKFVTASRFFADNTGYFFVYDTKGVCVAHGSTPALVGRSLIDYEDEKGFPVIRAIVDTGRAGGGFLEYLWDKPDAAGSHEKLGYVMPIPGTDFIIGSGLYLSEITDE
ncbi:cache domain-containing protein [Pseudodesulfovibrio pelocollis]|uniref:cache domain-containing protein n=1 Tax=Pseudodesulfovibrio pelocollis TaxID=3051432 RepID=UPI00255A77E4|nr:cache domain-containing protein [Pseudodesulfovibrio sp. SB368]